MSKRIVKSSQSSRRHNFSSFRERIDATKIEPNLKLLVRAYDDVETSHFRASLDHWSEVNLSGNFAAFVDEVDGLSQSLPQLIHHQTHIFEALVKHIEVVDAFSLEPLLELLSQFIHDLGPDFMVFYSRSLELITTIVLKIEPNESQNNRNSSNVLEWCFNSLAFAFKYLSRTLAADLTSTIDALLPLLVSSKKHYLARFSAEALSYLVKKQSDDGLLQTINHALVAHSEELGSSEVYRDSLVVLFGEAMKGTEGSFHSKAMKSLGTLISAGFTMDENRDFVSQIVSKIVLLLINYGNINNSKKIYITTIEQLEIHLSEELQVSDLTSIVHMLVSLTFADSGKKNLSWKEIISITDKITKLTILNPTVLSTLNVSLVYLYCVIIRNSPTNELMKYLKQLLSGASKLSGGKYFFAFMEGSLALACEKVKLLHFNKFVNEFLESSNGVNCIVPLSYFLLNSRNKDVISDISIPGSLAKSALDVIESSGTDDADMPQLCSALIVVKHLKYSENLHLAVDKLDSLWKSKSVLPERALAVSLIINLISSNRSRVKQDTIVDTFSQIIKHMEAYKVHSTFLDAIAVFLNEKSTIEPSEIQLEQLCSSLLTNLSSPDRSCRASSTLLIEKSLISLQRTSDILPQIKIIEQTPLSVHLARDITLRIRNLYSSLHKIEGTNKFDNELVVYYTFGLLSNKFQPCWEAVFENLPLVCDKLYSGLWDQAVKFIFMTYTQSEDSTTGILSLESEGSWLASDQRLKTSFEAVYEHNVQPYLEPSDSLKSYSHKDMTQEYSPLMRTQAIKVLRVMPSVLSEHLQLLVSWICTLIDGADSELNVSMGSNWTMKDRNLFIGTIVKTKLLKKFKDRDFLYLHLLKLLSSKQSEGQKLSMEIIFNLHDPTINKYRDHFNNLLDDTLFKDEVVTFFSTDSSSIIEVADYAKVINIALHILFGRAQRNYKSNSNMGKKSAVFQAIGKLEANEIAQFLQIGAGRFPYESFFDSTKRSDVSLTDLRKCVGFFNLLIEIIDVINPSKRMSFFSMVRPIICGLGWAQRSLDEDKSEDDIHLKLAKQVRLTGLKCFASVVKLLGDDAPWNEYSDVLFEEIFGPRLANFAQENLQQPSALLGLLTSLVTFQSSRKLLYYNDFHLCHALMSLLSNQFVKGPVVLMILNFCFNALAVKDSVDDRYYTLLAIIVDGVLQNIPRLIQESENEEVISKSIQLLLKLIDENYVKDKSIQSTLLHALLCALDRPSLEKMQVQLILQSISLLLQGTGFGISEVWSVFDVCSKRLRTTSEKEQRELLLSIFIELGSKIDEVTKTAELVDQLNSFKSTRREPDFDRRLHAFREVNEVLYQDLNVKQWIPLLYCALYYINDQEELTMRSNSTYMLCRFVDCFSNKKDDDNAKPFIHILKDVILPCVRSGLRNRNADVQSEYVNFLAHVVEKSKYYTDMDDMKALLFNNDEEANFFKNINHIQLHRRQRAIIRIRDYRTQLTSSSIAHYILPMVEYYSITNDEKLRNISNESVKTISFLARRLSWSQFRAVLSRYLSMLKKSKEEGLSTCVSLVVALAQAALGAVENYKLGDLSDTFTNIPSQDIIDGVFSNEVLPNIIKILSVRNDETIVSRILLGEGVVSLLMCISEDLRGAHLTSALTSLCQVLRSRSEELRDAVRKTLGRILSQLGSTYLLFICKELKTALSRGSQIHVLSFTLHFLLTTISLDLLTGMLDDSCTIIVDIIMEDIFGSAGQEKDAEGYHSKMKEVKHKTSFDTAEILTSYISLSQFELVLSPLKLILKENASLNVQKKIDELVRRYNLGLNHNSESRSKNVLLLSYEIFNQSLEQEIKPVKETSESQDHFLVRLDKNIKGIVIDRTFYVATLQKFALEIFRSAISRNEDLKTVGNAHGFLLFLQQAVNSNSEEVAILGIKILNLLVRLPFEQDELDMVKVAFRKCISNIKNSPLITSELSQTSLRFLSAIVRHRPEIELKDNTIGYLLTRILPGLEESISQGNAFNFVRAVVSQHILIPEVYDLMDKISKIMVVNHHRDVRNMARSVYLIFLMEYDQGKGKLQRQFKFLIDNLGYPTSEGRQSVMELLNSIVLKAGTGLVDSLASSFFVMLANVTINDDSRLCREMASSILKSLMGKASKETLATLEKYCAAWLGQSLNHLLLRCGFNMYGLYVENFGVTFNKDLNTLAISNIESILSIASKNDESNNSDSGWEIVYSLLSTFSLMVNKDPKTHVSSSYLTLWKRVFSVLLYPHSWVRLVASRLVNLYLSQRKEVKLELTNFDIQTIAYRLLRQLSAPSITQELGSLAVTNLLLISMDWQENSTPYQSSNETTSEKKYVLATDFVLSRVCGLLRQDAHQQDFLMSKKHSVNFLQIFSKNLSDAYLLQKAEDIILALISLNDSLGTTPEEEELSSAAQECLQVLESKLGVSEYTRAYANVQNYISQRRQERKVKRTQAAIIAPEAFAKRKLRKHERFREKRKHEKDENGYYKPKKRRSGHT